MDNEERRRLKNEMQERYARRRKAEESFCLVRELATVITGVESLSLRFLEDESEREYLRSVAVHLTDLMQKNL